jgi:pimeloyl-ACP methyl ester carboxylesterase
MPTVTSGDAEIYWEQSGSGPPLLLIMGLGSDSRGWTLQRPVFAEHYRTIVFDNRGVGRTRAGASELSTELMARDAVAVLDAAGVERAHVLGVSLGGAIAQHVALGAPDRVRSLVLASTWAGPSEWRTRLRRVQLDLARLGHEELLRFRLLCMFSPRYFIEQPDMIALVEKVLSGEDAVGLAGYLSQIDAAEEHDVRARLSEIAVPTLVITGKRDILVPPELSGEIAGAVPGATLVVLETAHTLLLEEAESFNDSVLKFLAQH